MKDDKESLKKTNITLITIAIIITIINHFVFPIFFKMKPDSVGTGISIILLASVLLNNVRSK
ncbi:hypothetical protein M3226_31050 [Neobacillus cucumis]|uniref:hypothetical protein n=1 Tax=Neobacillus cucumis TaxID=1740721 RepID=UPI0020400D68|nr:hypothetical protein [Neobacillus cucumis]MCM3729958.1 hypothetical protein [Neobacillus cucumis]